ncbi:macro domain-containing protein [uncultured Sphingomonas sp.]|uniref:type II toxin-antitoxin system antitoxin DNA ADP-ribosyl glycohydrolase DarG n=1 Tax=uncultured Sphingomonas sp. TaxID=158754 RepID=UPI0025F0624B|nr:macro domain-containing protein [uncultured Sphingomonas sp.]
MTITFKIGDMFAEPVEAIVNTVNCVGVMGKGVALAFKKRWPANFKVYKAACDAGTLVPGTVLTYEQHQLFGTGEPRFLVNFPTKLDWRDPSRLSYIETGLDALIADIRRLGIRSIALPPLGCGNGGLDWADVKPIIVEKLSVLDDVDIIVLAPRDSADEPEFVGKTTLAMNATRATLLKTLSELEIQFDGAFDRLSLQKIVYLLQAFGIDFKLDFRRNLYGPYSETLKKAFGALERHGMIAGFFDGEKRAHVTPAGCAGADEFLITRGIATDPVIQNLSRLIEGYESPYGMELLSSVHALASDGEARTAEDVAVALSGGRDHRNTFDDPSIHAAYDRLANDGLITRG